MKFGPVPLQAAAGLILGHNIAGLDGRRALRKGRALSALDLAQLTALGRSTVYVAEMAADDVAEDAAARRVAAAVAGSNLRCSGAASGRVNLAASVRGVLRVDAGRLLQVNALPGITVATLANHSPVQARQLAATVKIVPFAVPDALVRNCEEVAAAQPLLWLDAIPARRAAIILSGSAPASARIIADFEPALRGRLEALGASVNGVHFVALEDEGGEAALAAMLRQQLDAGCEMILLAGETAIMDRADIAPRAVESSGMKIGEVQTALDASQTVGKGAQNLAKLGDMTSQTAGQLGQGMTRYNEASTEAASKVKDAEGQEAAASAQEKQAQGDLRKESQEALDQMVKSIIQFLKDLQEAKADQMRALTRV